MLNCAFSAFPYVHNYFYLESLTHSLRNGAMLTDQLSVEAQKICVHKKTEMIWFNSIFIACVWTARLAKSIYKMISHLCILRLISTILDLNLSTLHVLIWLLRFQALYHVLPMEYVTISKLQNKLAGEANQSTARKLLEKMIRDGYVEAKGNRGLGACFQTKAISVYSLRTNLLLMYLPFILCCYRQACHSFQPNWNEAYGSQESLGQWCYGDLLWSLFNRCLWFRCKVLFLTRLCWAGHWY